MRKSCHWSQDWGLGQLHRARGLHDCQVFEVTEFSREGAQPGAEGAPLLALPFPTGLQTRTQPLTEASETATEMVPDEAVEHRVDGGVGETQAESEGSEVLDGPVHPAGVQPAFTF